MIIKRKIIKHNPLPYGRFFLATEADEDEDTEEETPHKNTKVINASPDNRRRKDYSDYSDDDSSESDASNTNNETSNEDESTDDDTDVETDDTDYSEEDDSDNSETDENNESDESSESTDEDNSEDNNGNEDTDVETDDTDYSDDNGSDDNEDDSTENSSNDDNSSDDSNNSGDGDNDKGAGLDYDSTRKYNLFKNFMSLFTSVDMYISKLENTVYDDTTTNQIIKTATNNLREIRELLNDYMVIKYGTSSYVQSMLFYQRMVSSVQLVFKMIQFAYEDPDKKKK